MRTKSYKTFLESVRANKYDYPHEFIKEKLYQLVSSPELYSGLSDSLFILDYATRKYVLISARPMLGHNEQAFIEGGLDFVVDLYHTDDFDVYNKLVFPKNLDFLKKVQAEIISELVYTYTFRARATNGQYRKILQKNKYIIDPTTGIPRYSFGISIDVTDIKSNNTMLWQVAHKVPDSNIMPHLLVDERFYPCPEEQRFSNREKEILKMIADGLLVKEIANKLHVAERTVVNHKQNMFRKANAKNAGQLLMFGIDNGLL